VGERPLPRPGSRVLLLLSSYCADVSRSAQTLGEQCGPECGDLSTGLHSPRGRDILARVVMVLLESPVAVLAPAVYGLLGSLIGGSIAGSVSLLVAWQARSAAEQAWVRDNRRGIYAEFLTNAQAFLIALLKGEHVEEAYDSFFGPWGGRTNGRRDGGGRRRTHVRLPVA
jgi:hypothetical protein